MKKKVLAYIHTHWDREWYREFEEFRLRLIEIFDLVLDLLLHNQIPSFYFDGQVSALLDYLEIYPEKKSCIENLINQKKLFIGPFFCSSDSFLVSLESFIRNLKSGLDYSYKLNCFDQLCYIADSFGHSEMIPSVLKSFKLYDALFWRGISSKTDLFFSWDGINVINLKSGYFQDYLSLNISYKEKATLIENQLNKIDSNNSNLLLLPLGGDHLGLEHNIKDQIIHINSHLQNYYITIGSIFDYLQEVKSNYSIHNLSSYKGEFRDNSSTFLLDGVLSSHFLLKYKNAKAQWNLTRLAEVLQCLFFKLNYSKSYQKEIDFAYNLLIKNQAHDSIYGCSIDPVFQDCITRFNKIEQISNGIIKRNIRDFSNFKNENEINSTNNISIINLSNFNYRGVVKFYSEQKLKGLQLVSKFKGFSDFKLYNNNQVPITEDFKNIYEYLIPAIDLKPFSISSFNINDYLNNDTSKTFNISENSIENDFIKISIEDDKVNIFNKKNNIYLKDFILIEDIADIGDSYNFGPLKDDLPIIAKLISTKIIQKGKFQNILRLIYNIDIPQNSFLKGRTKKTYLHKINLDLILNKYSELLEFNLSFKNKSLNHKLNIMFNLKNNIDTTFADNMSKIIKRNHDYNYSIYENIPAKKGIELKTNIFPLEKFVFTQNLGFLTYGVNAFEIFKNQLKFSILRSTGIISNKNNPARGTPAGPPLDVPKLQNLGNIHASLAFSFANQPKDLYKISEQFYKPVIAFIKESDPFHFINIENDNIILLALKLDDLNNIILRLFNTNDSIETVRIELFENKYNFKIIECTSLEKDLEIVKNQSLEFRPFEIKTLKFISI